MTYGDLLPYASGVANINTKKYHHTALTYLNRMVPYIKKKVNSDIYKTQVEQFKKHLLDVYLDSILRNQYKSVPVEMYERAKEQQMDITSHAVIEILKNQLFD